VRDCLPPLSAVIRLLLSQCSLNLCQSSFSAPQFAFFEQERGERLGQARCSSTVVAVNGRLHHEFSDYRSVLDF
jgi:hypothetical protein